jgi:hypothetical protein
MSPDEDEFSPEEIARRRDAVLKIIVNTPPQPRTTRQAQSKNRKPTGAGRARKTAVRPQKP